MMMKCMKCFTPSVSVLLACFAILSESRAGVTNYTTVRLNVRVDGENHMITVPCSLTRYDGDDGRQGCNNVKYDYYVHGVPTWPVPGIDTFVIAYWDWVYDATQHGYTGGGGLSFSTNCHGFAFDVPDWPAEAATLIAGGNVNCWVSDFSNAKIATNITGHTIKIRVEDCPLSVGLRILESYEKFKESGIYTKMTSCSSELGGLDIWAGNGPRADLLFDYYREP
jgi:hypothetical protein